MIALSLAIYVMTKGKVNMVKVIQKLISIQGQGHKVKILVLIGRPYQKEYKALSLKSIILL